VKPLWVARGISALLALAALNAGAQAVLPLFGMSNDPGVLMAMQAVCAVAGGAAAFGAWRGRTWAPWMTVVSGAVTGGMIISLGPMLDLGEEAQKGLLASGGGILVFCALLAWALRWAQIRKY
jgi:hypothetical protein